MFSTPFGENEKYGAVAFGPSYGGTWIDYGFNNGDIYELVDGGLQQVTDLPQGETSFNNYGLLTNLKLG